MIWLISLDECSMALMALTAPSTIWPEAWASVVALPTTARACWAPAAVLRTVAVIWSRAAAVSSRLAA